jgi:hypothetical protein
MSASDPVSHSLRGLIGNAIRWGDEAAADEFRAQLRVHNVKQAIAKHLDGHPPLTAVQVRELRLLVESFGPQRAPAPVAEPDSIAV